MNQELKDMKYLRKKWLPVLKKRKIEEIELIEYKADLTAFKNKYMQKTEKMKEYERIFLKAIQGQHLTMKEELFLLKIPRY